MERRLLQIVTALVGLLALVSGGLGTMAGATFVNASFSVAVDSYVRFLFGMIFAIGIVLLVSIPAIEKHGARFSVLTLILVVGGLARVVGVIAHGVPTQGALIGLSLELIVAPLLWLWQRRIARRCASQMLD